jgi:addiction module HigA family antidote
MTQMHNPPHPGESLLEDVLPALGLTVTSAADQLGVSRVQLSRVLHGHSPITPQLALRLEKWLQGTSAEVWLNLQLAHDIWHARKNKPIKFIKFIKPAKIPSHLKHQIQGLTAVTSISTKARSSTKSAT